MTTSLPSRETVLKTARAAGRKAGAAYRRGERVEPPGSANEGPLLVRQATSEWQRGFAETSGKTGELADSASRALAHEPLGKPGGPGLWGMKSAQLPAFIQHVRNDIMAGHHLPESQATAIAVSQCRKLAAKGNREAAAAIAEFDRLRAKAKATRSTPMSGGGMSRSAGELVRIYPLEDIHILSRADGDGSGRVVEAYATVFDQAAEIHDHQGHYTEVIDRSAFDQVLARIARAPGGLAAQVKVLFNHGRTIGGAEAPEFQLPLGKPLDVRPEQRGLLTRTEYDASDPFTERILSKIHAGTITAQSFVGGIVRSSPELKGPGDRHRARNGALTTVRRMVLGLREYGPVLFPAYSGAEILGVRMSIPGTADGDEPDDETPDSTEVEESEPGMEGDGTGGIPEEVHPTRDHAHRLLVTRTEQMLREAGIAPLNRGR